MTKEELLKARQYLKQKKVAPKDTNVQTAQELLEKAMPGASVAAALLDTVDEENLDEKEIAETFGKETLEVLKTLKQIKQITRRNYGKLDAGTLSSIILSISGDYQALIVVLAEEINELQEGNKKQAPLAEEIYPPIATKLGLWEYAWKLSDYAFKATNPEGYRKIKLLVGKTRTEREKLIFEVKAEVEDLLKGKINAEITGRPKNFKSIYEKMKKVPFQKINDIYGVRIICEKEKECYEALGYIHSKYEIIPEAFDDYIAKPKSDGYKSIHTAVKRGGEVIEVQIRTVEQHLRTMGETYWAYKKIKKDKEFEKELSWERQLVEWQKATGGTTGQGRKSVGKKIFVFTPKNEAIVLPVGASIIDFAFAIHTDIGKRTQKAKVNGKFVPIETTLNNLDRAEIFVSEKPQLRKTWLTFVASEKAKTKIKAHFKMKTPKKKKLTQQIADVKKVKLAECCHPLPGEDVVGVKTTKRKIIVHKKDCPNIAKIGKNRLVEIGFERDKGKTLLRVKVIDRPGILGEILLQIRNCGAALANTNFKIKKSGYAEAIFELEISSAQKLENLKERIEAISGVQSVERQ